MRGDLIPMLEKSYCCRESIMYSLFRPILFLFDPENVHRFMMGLFAFTLKFPGFGAIWRGLFGFDDSRLHIERWEKQFYSPVILAAGFDKNGDYLTSLAHLAFGAIEMGTVTAEGQPGNSQPRLFRLPDDKALLNRMGFNNAGAEVVAQRLSHGRSVLGKSLLGINIGKSKSCPLDDAASDYRHSVKFLARFADYLVVNVSSPNTPGLRDLQAVETLRPLLLEILEELGEQKLDTPLLLKVAPDLADDDVRAIGKMAVELKLAGIIATNTTISREALRMPKDDLELLGAGGISGAPVKSRSLEVLKILAQSCEGKITLVAAGGIASAEDAWERIIHGASLVQLYTGFVYGGPALPKAIARGLVRKLEDEGLASIEEAVGLAFKKDA